MIIECGIEHTEKLSQIVPVIVGRVLFRVITGRNHGHLVAVKGAVVVISISILSFLSDATTDNSLVVEKVTRLLVDLARAVVVAPNVQQSLVHRPRSELGDLAEVAECRELCVRDAHVGLVGLDVGRCDGFEFGGWGRV